MWAEIQKRLREAGKYSGHIDGIPGAQTAQAIIDYMGITPTITENLSEHFTVTELLCPCCSKCYMDTGVLALAERLREHFGGKPYNVTSGFRCQKHNAELPGSVPNSYHLSGRAIDGYITGVNASEAVAKAYEYGAHYAYVIDGNCFHIDI